MFYWDPAHPPQGAEPPIFGPYFFGQLAGWIKMPLGREVGLRGAKREGTQFPHLQKGGKEAPIFGQCLLWPNGWMDQDGTWHGGGSQSRPHCARWGPSSLPQKGAEPPIFGPCLLRPNGCMGHDATWYGGRPRPDNIVLDGDLASLPKRGSRAPSIFGPTDMDRKVGAVVLLSVGEHSCRVPI